jgi:hypothetical protein
MRIFGPKRDEVTEAGENCVDRHSLYSLPHVIRVMKSRRTRWMSLVACMGEMENPCKILVGKSEGNDD